MDRAIIVFYFFTALITDFSMFAEMEWMSRYSLVDSNYLNALTNLAWLPPVMWMTALVSDWIRKKNNTAAMFQFYFLSFLGCLFWTLIAVEANARVPDATTILALLVTAEFSPSMLQTILDGFRSVQMRKQPFKAKPLIVKSERMRLLGGMSASVFGGLLNHYSGVKVTFITQACLFGLVIFVSMMFIRAAEMDHVYDTIVQEDFGADQELSPPPPPPRGPLFFRFIRWLKPDPLEPQEARRFRWFMCTLICLPSADNVLYYFIIGPLGVTTVEIGFIGAISKLVEFLSTYVYGQVRLTLPQVGWLAGVSFAIGQFLMLLMVCRTTVEYVSNFHYLLVVASMSALVRGICNLTYTSLVYENTKKGGEALDTSMRKTMSTLGLVVKLAADTGLTSHYRINHNEYNELPLYLTLTCICSTVFIWTVLLVSHNSSPKKVEVEEEEENGEY